MPEITLISADEQEFKADLACLQRSALIKNMLEDIDTAFDKVTLPNVSGKILKEVNKSLSKRLLKLLT